MTARTISPEERAKMLRAHSIGPKMVSYLERAGIGSLKELRGRNASDVIFQIEIETGTKLNSMGLDAISNLIALAEGDRGR